MAANVAHYTATLEAKPSIFEIIAQNSLNGVLQPAFQKFTSFLAQLSPGKFQWLSQYSDEVFLIFNSILQEHYLRTTGAGFAEYFYGLQRARIDKITELTKQQKNLSLLFLVFLPYLKRKLNEKIEMYKLENVENSLQTNVSGVCKKGMIVLNAFFEVLYGSWTIIQYLRYMSDVSECQTPALQILKLKLVYAIPQETPAFWSVLFKGQLSWIDFRTRLLQNTAQSVLELSAFFMQFLQAWSAERPNYSFTTLPIVPPPPLHNKAADFKGRCPICLQNYKIPTVLPVSGYVFCFPCIIRHLQNDHRCPVTHYPAKPLDVIRLYDSDKL